MKGVIVSCLSELVREKFGEDKWEAVLVKSGKDADHLYLATEDVNDAEVMKLVGATCDVLGITLEQASEAFGEYWVCEFAPRVYEFHFRGVNTAKDFLLKMDSIHEITTKNMENALPPRFEYEWADDKTLVMTYKSKRGLMPIFLGLVRGVAKKFEEEVQIKALDDERVEIRFV